jgi:hypothetical protein
MPLLREAMTKVADMSYEFLSDEWFTKVDEMIAAAGDLQIPPAMKAAEINVTVTGAGGDTQISLKDGIFSRGHRADAPTSISLASDLARKIFVDGDAAAGIQAFLTGEIKVEGDLARLVAMQTTPPSDAQLRLSKQIASITR